MRYFKLIKNNTIFGVIDDNNFRRYQKKHKIILFSDIKSAQLIEYKNLFYWDNWLNPYPSNLSSSISVIKITEIEEDEYNILKENLQIEQQILEQTIEENNNLNLETLQQQSIESFIPVNDNTSLEYVKRIKSIEIEKENQKILKKGFDINLESGEVKHVSMTPEGLFNLITILINPNIEQEENQFIVQKMTQFKQRCDNYKNSLIEQINTLTDISEINNINYEEEKIQDIFIK